MQHMKQVNFANFALNEGSYTRAKAFSLLGFIGSF
jgi:hypothetical protein